MAKSILPIMQKPPINPVYSILYKIENESNGMVKQFDILPTLEKQLKEDIVGMCEFIHKLPSVSAYLYTDEDEDNPTEFDNVLLITFDADVPSDGYISNLINMVEEEFIPFFLIATDRVLH